MNCCHPFTGECKQEEAAKFDLTGKTFGRWTVAHLSGTTRRGRVWMCRCECGSSKEVLGVNLKSGDSKSCGCLKREKARAVGDRTRTHGMTNTSVYHIWISMIQRCTNRNRKEFFRYGGSGISVCDRWLKFENFISDMGDRPDGMSIDRINGKGNYEPSNCRWATPVEQARNTRANRIIEINGRRQCLKAWADEVGISKVTIQSRLTHGWTEFDAVYKPVEARYSHSKNLGKRKGSNVN